MHNVIVTQEYMQIVLECMQIESHHASYLFVSRYIVRLYHIKYPLQNIQIQIKHKKCMPCQKKNRESWHFCFFSNPITTIITYSKEANLNFRVILFFTWKSISCCQSWTVLELVRELVRDRVAYWQIRNKCFFFNSNLNHYVIIFCQWFHFSQYKIA